MRRGLISRSKAELPDAVLEARIARLRAAMGAAGLDKLIVYTNNTRPAGVSPFRSRRRSTSWQPPRAPCASSAVPARFISQPRLP